MILAFIRESIAQTALNKTSQFEIQNIHFNTLLLFSNLKSVHNFV